MRPATRALATALALAAALPAAGATGAWQANPQSRVRLVSAWSAAPASGPLRLGLELATEPGWHVYWKNSGDAGYPPYLDLSPTPEVTAASLLWPAPERYALPGDLEAFGYAGSVVYPVAGRLEATGRERVTLAADLDYLVCEVECIPYRYRLELDQALAAEGRPPEPDPAIAPLLEAWEARVPVAAESVPGLEARLLLEPGPGAEATLEVRLEGAAPLAGGPPPDLFLEASDAYAAGTPRRVAGEERGVTFRVPLTFLRAAGATAPVEVAWTVTRLARPGAGGEVALAVEARQTVAPAATAAAGGEGPASSAGTGALLAALLGGLLLHLTPTLLPVLAVRGLELRAVEGGPAGAARSARATAVGAFAGSLLLGGLALAVHARRPGTGWGAQLQEPGAVALLALVATLFSLHLWGLFRRPLALVPAGPPPVGPDPGRSFAVGLALPVLALPWPLPPLTRSLGPALAAGAVPGLAAFAFLGLGLALPYLLLAAWPGLARRLPAPADAGGLRPWARHLVEALGFLAATAVVWLLYLLSRQLRSDGLALVELTLLALALLAWLRVTARRRALVAALGLALVLLAGSVVWLAESRRLAPPEATRPVDPTVSTPNTQGDPRP